MAWGKPTALLKSISKDSSNVDIYKTEAFLHSHIAVKSMYQSQMLFCLDNFKSYERWVFFLFKKFVWHSFIMTVPNYGYGYKRYLEKKFSNKHFIIKRLEWYCHLNKIKTGFIYIKIGFGTMELFLNSFRSLVVVGFNQMYNCVPKRTMCYNA